MADDQFDFPDEEDNDYKELIRYYTKVLLAKNSLVSLRISSPQRGSLRRRLSLNIIMGYSI